MTATAPAAPSLTYLNAFARVISRLAEPGHERVLALLPAQLCSEFSAGRAELWLWDDSSASAYLTESAGVDIAHRRQFLAAGADPLALTAGERAPRENLSLQTCGADHEPLLRAGLTHASVYPLAAGPRVLGSLIVYTSQLVASDLLQWWRMYAEIAAVALEKAVETEQSQKTINQLGLLFEATRLLNSTLDLSELLDLILRIARSETHADRGSVFLVDARNKELWSIVASGLDHQEIRLPFGTGIAGRVAESGEIINVADAYELDFFDRSFDRKFAYRTRSLLCLPIRHHTGAIVGVIQLLNKLPDTAAADAAHTAVPPRFTAEDADFLTKLSGHMAMALENARLHREALERQRLERDLALARSIQHSLLPAAPPVIPGYDLAVLNKPCPECGGDYYDFLSLGPQTLLLVIADVEGKGVSSALVMSNVQATLRALVMHLHSLEVLALSLNEMICNDTRSHKYLSMFLGLVDTRRNALQYINAGHCPPLLINGETGEYRTLSEGGTLIGLFPNSEYTRGGVRMRAGDILVLCTDGVLEATNPAEQEYGHERLAACVARHRAEPAQSIVNAVLEEVNTFACGSPAQDDKVLMVLKITKDAAPQIAQAGLSSEQ